MLFWLTLAAATAWLLWYMVTVPGASYSGALKPLTDDERLIAENLRGHVTVIASREHNVFKLPMLDFRGSPIAVDVRRVVESGITPRINTGVLHRSAGTGQVGAGVAVAPVECFRDALLALDRRLA